jgi:hypothetical protein
VRAWEDHGMARGDKTADGESPSSRAGTRAHEAADRAASARERAHELSLQAHGPPADDAVARDNVVRQSAHARTALLNAAEGHERSARVHDDAAALDDSRGRVEEGAAHREAARWARGLADSDRAGAS